MTAPPGDALPARDRAPFYALASRLLLAEIDVAEYTRLAEPPVRALLERAHEPCEVWFAEGFSEARRCALREEYARLFLLPKGTPPFASAWLEGDRDALGAQIHSFVTAALRALGREPRIAEPWGRIPLDHLGLLLELVTAACARADDRGQQIAEHLCREALGPWVVRFGAALAANAEEPVYQALGRLLCDLHWHESPADRELEMP